MEKKLDYRFEVFFDTDMENPEYVVNYFDLPVGGQGKTINEAIEEAKENLEVYIEMCKEENISLPSPSKHIDYEDLSGKLTLRISKTLHKQIIDRASIEGVSLNALLIEAVTNYIAKQEQKDLDSEQIVEIKAKKRKNKLNFSLN